MIRQWSLYKWHDGTIVHYTDVILSWIYKGKTSAMFVPISNVWMIEHTTSLCNLGSMLLLLKYITEVNLIFGYLFLIISRYMLVLSISIIKNNVLQNWGVISLLKKCSTCKNSDWGWMNEQSILECGIYQSMACTCYIYYMHTITKGIVKAQLLYETNG